MTGPKITIKDAAELLRVTTKTIQRYLAKGRLTRVKEGTRTLLLLAEVKNLGNTPDMGQGHAKPLPRKTLGTGQAGDTVTLSRERYEQLLLELGELRKQNQFFMEFKGMLQAKEEAMHRLERSVDELRSRLQALESKTVEAYAAGSSGESREGISPAGEKTRTRPKKPWWQT